MLLTLFVLFSEDPSADEPSNLVGTTCMTQAQVLAQARLVPQCWMQMTNILHILCTALLCIAEQMDQQDQDQQII